MAEDGVYTGDLHLDADLTYGAQLVSGNAPLDDFYSGTVTLMPSVGDRNIDGPGVEIFRDLERFHIAQIVRKRT